MLLKMVTVKLLENLALQIKLLMRVLCKGRLQHTTGVEKEQKSW